MGDKRTDIVRAALSLVKEDGLAGLTGPRVARSLGLRQSHVTYYFPTRDDLLAAVAAEAVRQRIIALDAVRTATSTLDGIEALARVLVDPEQTRILLALTQMTDAAPELRSEFRSLASGIAPAAHALLAMVGAAPTPTAIALLQTTSTGLAVVALATGRTDPAPVVAQLTHLLAALPRQTALPRQIEDPT